VTTHQRLQRSIRRTTRTAHPVADLARELTRILAWACTGGLLIAIAIASSSGGAGLLLTALELAGSLLR